jgi:hypothetical protein
MTNEAPTRRDVQILLTEARRYLAAVEAFRAESCEPTWRPEREPAVRRRRRGSELPVSVPPIS